MIDQLSCIKDTSRTYIPTNTKRNHRGNYFKYAQYKPTNLQQTQVFRVLECTLIYMYIYTHSPYKSFPPSYNQTDSTRASRVSPSGIQNTRLGTRNQKDGTEKKGKWK